MLTEYLCKYFENYQKSVDIETKFIKVQYRINSQIFQ